jgi:hypothetical protein
MPTESKPTDLRDLYIKLNPNGWCDEDLEQDSLGFVDPHTSQDFNSFRAGHQAGQEDNERITAERDALQRLLNERDEDVDRFRADAERYRWLRDPDNQCAVEDDSDYYMPPMICGYAEHEDILTHEALDAAIDAARSKEAKS